jgi:hypothetical protein
MGAAFGFDRLDFFRNIEYLMTKGLGCLTVYVGIQGKRALLTP